MGYSRIRSSIRHKLAWLRVAGLALITLSIPAFIGHGNLTRRKFDTGPREELASHRPLAVLIGDSMLDTRIDEGRLRQVSGISWEKMARGGSGSAVWYLILKNYVARQAQPPRMAMIFFRDMQLTLADYHADGRYRPRLEAMMDGPELELQSTLQALSRKRSSTLADFFKRLFPIQRHQVEWQEKIQTNALLLSTTRAQRWPVKYQADHIFGARHLREDAGHFAEDGEPNITGLPPRDDSFNEALPKSLLPAMLKLTAQRKIQLVFFRVKHCPPPGRSAAPEPPYMVAYLASLDTYIRTAGGILIDESGDSFLGSDFYNNDDHIREDRMAAYTEHFWKEYGPALRTAATPEAFAR